MSRYVDVEIKLQNLAEVESALASLGLQVERGPIALEGSLECEGEPVDLRLPAGVFESVEDFGFVQRSGGICLVCGELDRGRLEGTLLPALTQAHAQARVELAARASGLQVRSVTTPSGGRRIILRRD